MCFLEAIPELSLGEADSYPGWVIREQEDKQGQRLRQHGVEVGGVFPSVCTVQGPRATALARAEDEVQTGSLRAEPEPQPQPRRVMGHASRARGGRDRSRLPS